MVVETVFVLMVWNGIGMARGDVFTRSYQISEHATEAACEEALLAYGRRREGELSEGEIMAPVVSCVKATRLKITGFKHPDKPSTSWGEWWRTH
jgi:uncharacterized membrane-anchored protein